MFYYNLPYLQYVVIYKKEARVHNHLGKVTFFLSVSFILNLKRGINTSTKTITCPSFTLIDFMFEGSGITALSSSMPDKCNPRASLALLRASLSSLPAE
jgi:hypothetical protein